MTAVSVSTFPERWRGSASDDRREGAREALRREARPARARLRARAWRLPRRHRPERLGEDDAAAALRGVGHSQRRHVGDRAGAWRDRLPRARAARLPGADGAREPRPLRPALPRARAARADRDAARAVRPLGLTRPAGGQALARPAAKARALPLAAAQARA